MQLDTLFDTNACRVEHDGCKHEHKDAQAGRVVQTKRVQSRRFLCIVERRNVVSGVKNACNTNVELKRRWNEECNDASRELRPSAPLLFAANRSIQIVRQELSKQEGERDEEHVGKQEVDRSKQINRFRAAVAHRLETLIERVSVAHVILQDEPHLLEDPRLHDIKRDPFDELAEHRIDDGRELEHIKRNVQSQLQRPDRAEQVLDGAAGEDSGDQRKSGRHCHGKR